VRKGFLLLIFLVLPVVHSLEGVHKDFDWEGDGLSDGPGGTNIPQEGESCFACHAEGIFPGPTRICEECHIEGGYNGIYGPFDSKSGEGYSYELRGDYRAPGNPLGIPMVYQHYFDSEVTVPSQLTQFQRDFYEDYPNLTAEITLSRCFGYANVNGVGSCHGVSEEYSSEFLDGKFAFKQSLSLNQSDPYTFQTWTSNMPDTSDCLYCHVQEDTALRKAWGNPAQVILTSGSLVKETCYECHVDGGAAPESFHAASLLPGDGSSPHAVSQPGAGGGVLTVEA